MAAERWSRLHPTEAARKSHVEQCLEGHDGPVIAATDYMRNYADQVREYVQAAGRRYTVLGTDGFGRSDYRRNLRRFFEVDRWHVVVAALKALADDGVIKHTVVAEAIEKYGLQAERAAPWTV
jgi:pyruvate dehydrogenase E1 component